MTAEKKMILEQLVKEGHEYKKVNKLGIDKLKSKLAPAEKIIEEFDKLVEEGTVDVIVKEPKGPSKDLEAMIQKGIKDALVKRYVFKARFFTLLDLTLKTRNHCSHSIESQYKRLYPVPHPRNFNADALEIYEAFKKELDK